MTSREKNWIETDLKQFPNADRTVLEFIAQIVFHNGPDGIDGIYSLFGAGYCYYFAKMLQDTFQRGLICYAYNRGHIVWLDGEHPDTDVAYDIYGVSYDWEYLIRVEKLGLGLLDFMHIPGLQSDMSDTEIAKQELAFIENKEYLT